MNKYDLDGPSFGAVERDLYVDPPNLSPNASEEEKLKAWNKWQAEENAKRRAHKAAFTRKHKSVPSVEYAKSTVKINGVYKQHIGSVGLNGSVDEETIEQIVAVQATQDKHFQPRGKRAGNKSKIKARKRIRNKLRKAQKLLSQRSMT